MVRVKDGKWGGVENGESDIVMTSVKINSACPRTRRVRMPLPTVRMRPITALSPIPAVQLRRTVTASSPRYRDSR